MTVLDFEVELAPDVWVDETAAKPRSDYSYITLTDVTADEAAAFARWLRDSFPPGPGPRTLRQQPRHGQRRRHSVALAGHR